MTDLETLMRDLWLRVMRDADGKLLPSEAAKLVAAALGVSPIEVILAAGSKPFEPRKDHS